uniref:Uncharacterized protein n=1 Tax=Anguilla anguilla TaxID=7936 RepID=A0A0E9QW18_ANGAN
MSPQQDYLATAN